MLVVIEILLIILTVMNLYRMFISLFGFRNVKREYELVDDEKTFLFLVPACNEENVIKDSLLSLRALNYNKRLYSITTLVNNSSDNTFEISKELGINTLDIKFDETESKGKPHVLRKFFNENNFWKKYDYIVILDADNIVSRSYLKEINSQIIDRENKKQDITVVQGYLGSKNIFTSLMSCGYAASYFIANRAYQYAKHVLGFNTSIGGTGFALKSDYIKEHGWNPKSYTEDFELQIELSIAGKKSIWNHFAVIYDEKPIKFLASHKQRVRWAQGHWYIGISTTLKQIISMFNLKQVKLLGSKIESLIYSYSMARPIVWLTVLITVIFIDIPEKFRLKIFSFVFIWLVLGIYEYLILPIYMLRKEAMYLFNDEEVSNFDKFKRWIKLFISGYYCGITYIIQQLVGFFTWFRPQNNWVKTTHIFGIETNAIRNQIESKEREMDDLAI